MSDRLVFLIILFVVFRIVAESVEHMRLTTATTIVTCSSLHTHTLLLPNGRSDSIVSMLPQDEAKSLGFPLIHLRCATLLCLIGARRASA